MSKKFFREGVRDPDSLARTGVLRFENGRRVVEVPTPVFMPVGTQGTVKALWQEDLEEIGYDLILGNTYHLYLRPGEKIKKFGGLKGFISWEDHAVLTDSGGYQVYSLSDRVKFFEDGVEFSSHIDGSKHRFTPENVVEFQNTLGSDIMMVLDDCPPGDADRSRVADSSGRTHAWAKRAIQHHRLLADRGDLNPVEQKIFGIIQGGMFEDTRRESARIIQDMPFDGIAIGGMSVGESREKRYEVLSYIANDLDPERPRYMMGVGVIPDFLEAVRQGVDMFDCVLPTRNARNGQALTSVGKINIRNAVHGESNEPLDPACNCRVCRRYSRGYIRHLFITGEMLGSQMVTFHNLFFFYNFMSSMRESIENQKFMEFYRYWSDIPF